MATSYNMKAAEAAFAKAEKFHAAGEIKLALRDYKEAEKFYQAAKKEDWKRSAECASKIALCAEKINALSNPAYVPVSEIKPAPYATAPQKTYSTPAETTEKAPGTKGDYSQYTLNIVKPNNSMMLNDIAGLEEAKKAVDRMIISPIKNADVYEEYGLQAGGLILLYGPPGTGKTTFAKAVANELGYPMALGTGSTLVDSYIGATAKNIKQFFAEARRFAKEQDTPLLIFIDEFECIAKSRASDDKTAQEAVPELLQQLDGFDSDNKNILIIAATNYYNLLDSAIRSRYNKKIEVPLPDKQAREFLFKNQLKGRKLKDADSAALDFSDLAEVSEGLSGRDIKNIMEEFFYMLAKRDERNSTFTLENSHMDILYNLIHKAKKVK